MNHFMIQQIIFEAIFNFLLDCAFTFITKWVDFMFLLVICETCYKIKISNFMEYISNVLSLRRVL